MKKILIILSFIIISCQSNSGEMPRQSGLASNELMNGLEAMHNVRFAEARASFLEGIQKDPSCASCFLYLGHAEQDRVLKREYLETALDLAKKGHPETKIMEASVNWINGEGGRFDAHPDLYKKYKGDKFLASGAYRYLQSNDQIDKGRDLLIEAGEKLNAGHLYNLLAYSYFWNAESDEDYDKGLPFIEKYIELNPNEANAYDSLAEFHLNKGEFEKAIETYQLAFEVDPEFEWAIRNLALAKYQQKMSSDNSKVMNWTSESNEAKTAFNVGLWELYNLEWEKANESFSTAIEIDESFALAYAMRARTHNLMQNQSASVVDLEIAVSMSENASPEEKKMIMALSNDSELGTNSFKKVIERLVRKYPDGSFLRMESIFATMSEIGPDLIIRRAKDLYAMNPNFTPALNILGYAYMQKDEFDLAKDTLQEQVRRQSGKANPYDSLGDYYLAVNDNEMALKYFEQSSSMGLKASDSKVDSLKTILSEK